MILTNSSAAKVGGSNVSAIASSTASFRHFMCYLSTTVSQAISGTTGLIKNGIGGLTLSGVCNYTGPTEINAGQIAISSASTLNGVISGAGSLTKTGATALILGGSNTYSGGTLSAPSAASGTITFSQNNAFGTGLFTSAGPSQIVCTATSTLSNNFQVNAVQSLQFRVNTGTTILTISGNIAGSGSINKTSTGQLRLNGTLTYTGSTTITAGILRAITTVGASTATATFTPTSITVDFGGVAPKTGTVFKFFPGATSPSNLSLSLLNAGGAVGTYNFANSSLSVGTTPSTTGMQVWLDASVADTLYTATTGGTSVSADATAVARWEDISGNGRHLTQATATYQPLLKTGVQNGRNVLRFDGTNDELNIASFPNTTNTTHIFAVFKLNGADFSSGQGQGRFIKSQFNSATTQFLMLGAASIAYGASYGMGVGTILSNADYTILSIPFNNNASLFSITKPASGTTEAHRNGVLVGQETATAAAACTTQKLQVGGDISNGNGCMRGDMCEVIVYSSPLTAAERQAVETYLNNKWAIY